MLRSLPLVLAVGVVASCTDTKKQTTPTNRIGALEPAPVSIKDLMRDRIALSSDLVMISEASFQALVSQSNPKGVDQQRRERAATAAAHAADELSLGVFGRKRTSYVEADLFVVARNPALSSDDDIEATDFYVVAGQLSGEVEWWADGLHVAVLENFPKGACSDAFRGCRGLFGSRPEDLRSHRFASSDEALAGLPSGVTANFESPPGPNNASSQRPTLRIFSDLTTAANEFECHLPLRRNECEDTPISAQKISASHEFLLPENTIILSEREFLLALESGQPEPASGDAKIAAVEVTTLANADQAVGVQGELGGGDFDAELFVVVRSPILDVNRIQARQFYVAAVRLSGTASWLGTAGMLLFEPSIPGLPGTGPCGPVSVTEEGPRCDVPDCLPVPIPIQDNQPLFGNNRWPAASRTTLRLPDTRIPTRDFTTFACARFQPVPPISPCGTPGMPGQSFIESCNGLDDNCDGRIDENNVCANRNVCTTCQPRTCAQLGITCGTAHDGCNAQLLNCGAACP